MIKIFLKFIVKNRFQNLKFSISFHLQMDDLLSKLKFTVKDHEIQISGTYKAKAELRKELLKFLKQPEDTQFDSINIMSIVPDTPFYRRVRRYLSLCLDVPKEDVDPESIIEFHADWLRKDLSAPSLEKFVQSPFEIPFPFAAFLIETFSNNQPKHFQTQFSKQFLFQKTILNLNLLAPLPVAFEFIQQKSTVQLSFADTPSTTAQQIYNQVKLALNIFNTVKPITIRFSDVCSEHSTPEFLRKLSEDFECVILLQYFGRKDPKIDLVTFDLYVLPSRPGKDYRETLIMKFKDVFDKYFNAKHCPRCGKFFPVISSSNEECGINEHEGNQIPFDDGQLEHVETLEDGTTMTLVRFECCGEVEKGSTPTEFMKFGDLHIPEENPKVYSAFNSQTY